jgi:putative colanic acid biosynthesis glycosyltransferase
VTTPHAQLTPTDVRPSAQPPVVSIVTVAYNAAATIEATIQSVISQTYGPVEHIIVDGGSSDGTAEIIRRYEQYLGSWVSEEDNGIYDAMNKGVAAARGEWVLFLNCGDTLAGRDVLAKTFSRELPGIDIIFGNTLETTAGKRLRPPSHVDRGFFYFETLCHQSILARRKLFNRIGTFSPKYRIVADREWLLRAVDAQARFLYIDVDVCLWNPEGFSSANALLSRREVAEFQSKHFTPFERLLLPWQMRARNLARKTWRVISSDLYWGR